MELKADEWGFVFPLKEEKEEEKEEAMTTKVNISAVVFVAQWFFTLK